VQVSGHIIRSRYIYVRQRGEEAYQQVLAGLQPETRKLMEDGPLETVWYPFDLYLDLSVVADRVLGTGDLQVTYEMGSFSCEHNLTGIYRVFFRFGNLNFLLDRAAKAWKSQYDFGTMSVTRDPENKQRITMELADVPRPHRAMYLAVWGWAVKAAQLSGSEIVDFVEEFSEEPLAPMRWTFEYL
jgi:hypothetical protein